MGFLDPPNRGEIVLMSPETDAAKAEASAVCLGPLERAMNGQKGPYK
jgi:hypothetical protein